MNAGSQGPTETRRTPLAVALSLLLGAGCVVTTYQPERGLGRPVLVDTKAPNLEGTRVLVRCFSNDELPVSAAQQGCRQLARAFSAQGAVVETEVPRPGKGQAQSFEGQGPELVLEWKSRRIKQDTFVASDLLYCLTCTCLPLVAEYTFAHEGEVRGRDGSVLLSAKYQARFVETVGCASGTLAFLLDLYRPEEEKLGWSTQFDNPFANETKATRDYSRDVYGQLSQLLYNAKARSEVLGLTSRRRPRGPQDAAAGDEPAASRAPSTGSAPAPESQTGEMAFPPPPPDAAAQDTEVTTTPAENRVFDPAEGGPPAPPGDPEHAPRQHY